MTGVLGWLEHRTGIGTAVRRFMDDEIPASAGWHQVFGSVAVFLFLVQAFTGVLLALNFAPTPPDAYHSLRYILTQLTGGHLIHGLHHWGASMMIVVVVVHMVQVFLYGAYKAPREATWMAGVVLLLLTLAYGLTGYLLPWDNRAYWGTVVTTEMAAKAPVLGPLLSRLLGGGVGVVTFARFYAVHVLLLPPATVLMIVFHVYLVRKHGITPVPGDEARIRGRFFPRQAVKDTVAIFVSFAVLFVMAVAAGVPLERLADPTDTSYVPRPEWYFLFLFQFLKALHGPLEALGGTVLPALAVAALFLVPFLDRGRVVRVTRRVTAFGVVALALAGWAGLTAAAVAGTPAPSGGEIDYSQPSAWITVPPSVLAQGKSDAPRIVVDGAQVYQNNKCGTCHLANGEGNKVGPPLNGLSRRRTRTWVEQHFRNPRAASPGTIMPTYRFSQREMDAVVSYLFTLE